MDICFAGRDERQGKYSSSFFTAVFFFLFFFFLISFKMSAISDWTGGSWRTVAFRETGTFKTNFFPSSCAIVSRVAATCRRASCSTSYLLPVFFLSFCILFFFLFFLMCVVVRGSIIKYEEKKNKKKKPTPKVDAIHISCESIPLPIISDVFFYFELENS